MYDRDYSRPSSENNEFPRTLAAPAALPMGLIGMQVILAYEWLVSALDKLGNAHFGDQLESVLQQSSHNGPYGWYSSLLRQFVLPYHAIFAPLTQATELAIGLTLALSAALWLFQPTHRLTVYGTWASTAALLGSIFLSINYFFQTGYPIPWINPNNSFVPGVDINTLVALLSLLLLMANARLLYRRGHGG